jgi:hypothetical protein
VCRWSSTWTDVLLSPDSDVDSVVCYRVRFLSSVGSTFFLSVFVPLYASALNCID